MPSVLVDEDHARYRQPGDARRVGLRAGGPGAPEGAAGSTTTRRARRDAPVRLWAPLDAWFEEDEQVFVHPRNPYARVDALRSTPAVRVELEGIVLAESASPVMVFETGLPTRYYFDRTAVDFTHLVPVGHRDRLPVQGRHQRVLVGAGRRGDASRPGLVLRLPDAPAAADRRPRRVLQREGRREHRRRAPCAAGDALLPIGSLIARAMLRALVFYYES